MLMKAGITALDSFYSSITVQTVFGVTRRFYVPMSPVLENKRFHCACDAGIATTRQANGANMGRSWALGAGYFSDSS